MKKYSGLYIDIYALEETDVIRTSGDGGDVGDARVDGTNFSDLFVTD